MRQVNDMFGHVVQNLTAQDFLKADGVTGTPSAAEQALAQSRLDFLLEIRKDSRIEGGGSDILATFVALAQVDDSLRSILQEMKSPKQLKVKWTSVDEFFQSVATTIMNLLTTLSLTRDKALPAVQEQLDLLTVSLGRIQTETRLMAALEITKKPGEWMEKANDFSANMVKTGSEKATAFVRAQSAKTSNNRVKQGLAVVSMVTALGSKELSAEHGESLTKLLNNAKGWNELRALVNEFRSMTATNAPLLRMINRVKALVDAIRQDARERVPADLAAAFSRKLSRSEWSHLHMAIGRADMLSMGLQGSLDLMKDPSTVAQKIKDAEELVGSLGGKFLDRYKSKAKALAHYMVTRENTSEHLLKNANAIAKLAGEQGTDRATIMAQVTPDLIGAIGQLTSLYAFQELDQTTKDTLKDLMKTEPEGMDLLAGYHRWIRQVELERRDIQGLASAVAENNAWKGYVPSTQEEGSSIVVRDDSKTTEMIRMGYTRIGPYEGDSREGYSGKRSYFQSSVAGKNAFRQGVAQTVHDTYQGTNAQTGETLSGDMAGSLRGTRAQRLAKIANRRAGLNDGKKPGDYLIPILGANDTVVGYERPMDPAKLNGLQRDTNLARMLGVWSGRILEEEAAGSFNAELMKSGRCWHEILGLSTCLPP